jgi:hypothetical protein
MIVLLAALPVAADDVILRGGGRITGQIIERTDEAVTVDIGGATITAKMSSVERIEVNTSPLQQYRDRAAEIPDDDVEAWRELARWAKGYALSSQALEAYSKVLAVLPDDEEANRALGRVRMSGTWVSEEESYQARGYVYFEGAWMTPNERQSIIAARQAQEEAEQRENEARIREIEAEQKAEKERLEAERKEEELRRNPVSWNWGYGPRYWPAPVRRW